MWGSIGYKGEGEGDYVGRVLLGDGSRGSSAEGGRDI